LRGHHNREPLIIRYVMNQGIVNWAEHAFGIWRNEAKLQKDIPRPPNFKETYGHVEGSRMACPRSESAFRVGPAHQRAFCIVRKHRRLILVESALNRLPILFLCILR
jgi:hypothetical protein